jgi:hypothetical protein
MFYNIGPEIFLVFCIAVISAVLGIVWNGNWAFACDFHGGDLSSAHVTMS